VLVALAVLVALVALAVLVALVALVALAVLVAPMRWLWAGPGLRAG
jgi:hypothetical protein